MAPLLRLMTGLVASLGLLAGPAQAQQDYPNKPVRIIVPVAAGGITDILARLVGAKLQERWGQAVIVDNRSGAGGQIGNEAAARSPADGYTLLMSSSSLTAAPFVSKQAKLDPVADFTHVIEVAHAPYVLAVNSQLPVRNLREFIAYAKANPTKLNYGSLGVSMELDVELFKRAAGIHVTPIRYRGTGPVITALLNEEVHMLYTSARAVKDHVDSGKVRVLAVVAPNRTSGLPDVPTIAEAGMPGVKAALVWIGVSAPKGVPAAIVDKLNSEIDAIVRLPETRERLLAMGYEPIGGSVEQFNQLIQGDVAYYTNAQRVTKLMPE